MKCTDCGTEVKPIVAVDIDGTLGDYYTHFHSFAELYLDKKLPDQYKGNMEYSDYLELDKEVYRDIKLAYRQGGMKRSMPMYGVSDYFMNQLHRMGFEVWIATTRPYQRLDNIDPDTQFWLKRHGIEYDYLLYGEDKYMQLVNRVEAARVVMVIDDLKEQCIYAADVLPPWKVWTPERDHNRWMRWEHHFESWKQALGLLYTKKEDWYAIP